MVKSMSSLRRQFHLHSTVVGRQSTIVGKTSVLLMAAVGWTGCGLEGLVSNGSGDDFSRPVISLSGGVEFNLLPSGDEMEAAPTLAFTDSTGEVVEPVADDLFEDRYRIDLPVGVYSVGRLVAERNQVKLARYFGDVGDEFDTVEVTAADVDIDSTAIAMIIDTYLSAFDTNLQVLSGENVQATIERLQAGFASDTPARRVRDRIAEFYALADPDVERDIFRAPDFGLESAPDPNDPSAVVQLPVANESTINVVWLTRSGPSGLDVATTTTAFDQDLALAAFDSQLEGCSDPDNIKIVFEVNFNQGQLDQNCSAIVRDKWLRGVGDAGKRMFFVGGVHEDSVEPTDQAVRAELNAQLGNRGSWTPNSVPMFDDGTNGDASAGDNIWTVTFTVPRGTRMGYKFTWGFQGDSWTGTEEWPGNQRVVEAIDVNGDNFVRRRDNFGDESTNKDQINLYANGSGAVTWNTDANEDGFLDARELPLDQDNDCAFEDFVTPSSVAPATIECEEGM